MSSLTSPHLPSFKEAIISFWFRVPSKSMDTARANYQDAVANDTGRGLAPYGPLVGIVPLVTWGPVPTIQGSEMGGPAPGTYQEHRRSWRSFQCSWQDNNTYPHTNNKNVGHFVFDGAGWDGESSYIGIDCTSDRNLLSVVFQMGGLGGMEGGYPNWSNGDWPDVFWDEGGLFNFPPCPNYPATRIGTGINHLGLTVPVPTRTLVWTDSYDDACPIIFNEPESFRALPRYYGYQGYTGDPGMGSGGKEVAPDHWHHVIVSCDLTHTVATHGTVGTKGMPKTDGIDNNCFMWISLDDHNLTNKTLSAFWPGTGADPNNIITPNAFWFAGRQVDPRQYTIKPHDDEMGNIFSRNAEGLTTPTFQFKPEACPGGSFGIPAAASRASAILPVEMAEFQMWTGIHLDTGVKAGRRLFITGSGKPAGMNNAVAGIGKVPDIALHKTGNWQQGINTSQYTYVGNLDPHGEIKKYVPDPSLYGPQSPEEMR